MEHHKKPNDDKCHSVVTTKKAVSSIIDGKTTRKKIIWQNT